jgi:hypothetical protein
MANNGIYYSSGNSLNFTTNSTTWATLGSGGTFVINTVSGGTYLNLPVSGITAGTGIGVSNSNGNYTISYTGSTGISGDYLPLSGGTVTGGTIFTNGVTANTLSNVNYILFNKTATTTHTEGQIHWNDDTKTLEIDTDKTGVTYETGQNTLVRVTNKTGAPLTAGTVVYINGAQAGRPTVTKATYEQDATSARSLGFITQTINDNNQGYVTTNGLLRNVNTNSYTAGTQLYLYTGGTITNVRPVAPKHEVRLGYVVTQDSTAGVIYVYIQNGYEFVELHDVQISGQTDNDIPYWNSALGVWKNTNSPVFTSLTATTISASFYQNLPYSGTVIGSGSVNYIPKWTASDSIYDSTIYDDGTFVGVGYTSPYVANSRFGASSIEAGTIQIIGNVNSSIGITDTDLTTWTTTGKEIAIGYGGVLSGSSGYNNIGIGYGVLSASTTGYENVAIGTNSMISITTGFNNVSLGGESLYSLTDKRNNVAIGFQAGYSTTGDGNVFIGYKAGFYETGGYKLYIGSDFNPLIYGEFNNNIVGIIGTLTATTYQNLPVSAVTNGTGISASTSNGTVTITNTQVQGITGKTDGTGISSSISNNVISITNTDLGSSQNIFKNIKINGNTQFSAGSNNSDLNFSGINITITSAATNTLVFSAGTGGGGSGTVTSVALSAGTSGNDINIANSAITTSGVITINIPDASITGRGVVSTGTQTFKGNKTFDGTIGSLNFGGNRILASSNTLTIEELNTTTYPSLTELSYVKGVTSAIQTQLDNKLNTSGGTINGNLTVTGTTTTSTISATTYQNILASSISDSTTVGQNLVKLTNPSAISYLRVNADNTVTALTLAQLKSDLGLIRSVQANTTSNSSSSVAVNITGCTVSLDANSTYIGRMTIGSGCAGAGGFTLTFTFPSGASMYLGRNIGTTATNNQVQTWVQITSGTAIGQTFNASNNQTFYHELQIYIATAATSGNLTPSFLTVTNGTASTIYAFVTQIQLEKIS